MNKVISGYDKNHCLGNWGQITLQLIKETRFQFSVGGWERYKRRNCESGSAFFFV